MKTTRSLALACALAVPLLAGCPASGLPDPVKQVADAFGPRASAQPFTLSRGHILGRVYGADGKRQAIGLAFVTTGSISAFSANPKAEEAEDETPALKDRDNLPVLHTFDPEVGEEPALRIIRKAPPSQAPADRYVYLRVGEFFLEGIPEGHTFVTASYGNVTSPPAPVTVYKNTILQDFGVTMPLPGTLDKVNGEVPPVVEWAKLDPFNGVSVSVTEKRESVDGGLPITTSQVTYKPDPPDIAVTLKAPPGSPGTVISAYEVTYEYTTPNQQREGKPPVVVGPILVPTPPVLIPPAQENAFGTSVLLPIPIGSRTLNDVFKGPRDDQPGLVIANIEFKDAKGQPVPNRDLGTLKVSVPLRAL